MPTDRIGSQIQTPANLLNPPHRRGASQADTLRIVIPIRFSKQCWNGGIFAEQVRISAISPFAFPRITPRAQMHLQTSHRTFLTLERHSDHKGKRHSVKQISKDDKADTHIFFKKIQQMKLDLCEPCNHFLCECGFRNASRECIDFPSSCIESTANSRTLSKTPLLCRDMNNLSRMLKVTGFVSTFCCSQRCGDSSHCQITCPTAVFTNLAQQHAEKQS
mmetsp:Transcript_8515/g.31494  ORF Transcript_8515/g.31494 Transcript_8515/m.31494 type:complete len:219 (-) Transcript_8515:662-1318(-)